MRWGAGFVTGMLCLWGASTVAAQGTPEDRTRPIRVGNLNVAVAGVGYVAHDHPTYDDHILLNISYQRRILRRVVQLCLRQLAMPPAGLQCLVYGYAQLVADVLERTAWNISRTAEILDVDRATVYNKIKRYGLERPEPDGGSPGR